MAAVTMHNLCVCRAIQILSSWLTRALPSFPSKTLTSALDPHSCGMHLVDSNTSRVCVANATMCRSFANANIGYGFPPPKKCVDKTHGCAIIGLQRILLVCPPVSFGPGGFFIV